MSKLVASNLLVEAHVNEHGDGIVAVIWPKEVVGLFPLAVVRGSAAQTM